MNIKLFVMDVDGTLTDGCIYMGAEGEIMKAFHVKDGYGIAHILPRMDIVPVIITGRTSQIVQNRAAELKITELYQGIVSDKLSQLKQIMERYGVTAEQVAYIGDDENDLDCIRFCGYTACPQDAVPAVREAVDHICGCDGGRGAVREFIELIAQKQA